MRDTKSNPEVGLAFCDNRFHLAIVPERGIIRHYDGIVVSEKRMHDTIKEILKHKINFTPSRIAVSHHDPSVRSMIAEEFHVLAVPPTIATLEGLAVSPSSARSVLRRGHGRSGTTGLL